MSPATADAIADIIDSQQKKWWFRVLQTLVMFLPVVVLAYYFLTK